MVQVLIQFGMLFIKRQSDELDCRREQLCRRDTKAELKTKTDELQIKLQLKHTLSKLESLKIALMQDFLTGNKRVTPLLEAEDPTDQTP